MRVYRRHDSQTAREDVDRVSVCVFHSRQGRLHTFQPDCLDSTSGTLLDDLRINVAQQLFPNASASASAKAE